MSELKNRVWILGCIAGLSLALPTAGARGAEEDKLMSAQKDYFQFLLKNPGSSAAEQKRKYQETVQRARAEQDRIDSAKQSVAVAQALKKMSEDAKKRAMAEKGQSGGSAPAPAPSSSGVGAQVIPPPVKKPKSQTPAEAPSTTARGVQAMDPSKIPQILDFTQRPAVGESPTPAPVETPSR